MPPTCLDNFLGHLTLTLDWMAVSLGLWGYLREMDVETRAPRDATSRERGVLVMAVKR